MIFFFSCFMSIVILSSCNSAPEVPLHPLQGEKLFEKHCSACHIGGTNFILPEKNLTHETLAVTGMYKIKSLHYLVTNGKNGMPPFGDRLTEKEIEAIAIYVFQTSPLWT